VKIGLELYLRYGPGVVASIRGASGVRVRRRCLDRRRLHIRAAHPVAGVDGPLAVIELLNHLADDPG